MGGASLSAANIDFSSFDKNDGNSMLCDTSIPAKFKNSLITNNKIIEPFVYSGMIIVELKNEMTFDNCHMSSNDQGYDSLFGTSSQFDSIVIANSYILNTSTLYSGEGRFSYKNTTINLVLSLDPAKLCSYEVVIINPGSMKSFKSKMFFSMTETFLN